MRGDASRRELAIMSRTGIDVTFQFDPATRPRGREDDVSSLLSGFLLLPVLPRLFARFARRSRSSFSPPFVTPVNRQRRALGHL